MDNIINNYYKSYDKNIISTRGGGKITKGEGIPMRNTEQTISTKLKNDVNYMPPLFRVTDRGNSIETNTYVNPNNYVEKDGDIEDYYYSSQQINNMNIINKPMNKKESNKINMENPIQSPPPLITSYADEDTTQSESEEKILKEKIREKIKEKILKKIKKELIKKEIEKNINIQNNIKKEIAQKEKKGEFKKIKENIGKNLWINENNLYSVRSSQNNKLPWKDKQCILNLSDNRVTTGECGENFTTVASEGDEKKEIDYSVIIFIALMLTIVVVYVILKYRD